MICSASGKPALSTVVAVIAVACALSGCSDSPVRVVDRKVTPLVSEAQALLNQYARTHASDAALVDDVMLNDDDLARLTEYLATAGADAPRVNVSAVRSAQATIQNRRREQAGLLDQARKVLTEAMNVQAGSASGRDHVRANLVMAEVLHYQARMADSEALAYAVQANQQAVSLQQAMSQRSDVQGRLEAATIAQAGRLSDGADVLTQMQDSLKQARQALADSQTKVAPLEQAIADAQGRIDALHADLEQHRTKASQLQQQARDQAGQQRLDTFQAGAEHRQRTYEIESKIHQLTHGPLDLSDIGGQVDGPYGSLTEVNGIRQLTDELEILVNRVAQQSHTVESLSEQIKLVQGRQQQLTAEVQAMTTALASLDESISSQLDAYLATCTHVYDAADTADTLFQQAANHLDRARRAHQQRMSDIRQARSAGSDTYAQTAMGLDAMGLSIASQLGRVHYHRAMTNAHRIRYAARESAMLQTIPTTVAGGQLAQRITERVEANQQVLVDTRTLAAESAQKAVAACEDARTQATTAEGRASALVCMTTATILQTALQPDQADALREQITTHLDALAEIAGDDPMLNNMVSMLTTLAQQVAGR